MTLSHLFYGLFVQVISAISSAFYEYFSQLSSSCNLYHFSSTIFGIPVYFVTPILPMFHILYRLTKFHALLSMDCAFPGGMQQKFGIRQFAMGTLQGGVIPGFESSLSRYP